MTRLEGLCALRAKALALGVAMVLAVAGGAGACGGRAAEGDGGGDANDGPDFRLPDAGVGTPCQNDCDCHAQLACLGSTCQVADRTNQCCYAPFCPEGTFCELPGGGEDRCPDGSGCTRLDMNDCYATPGCRANVCPACNDSVFASCTAAGDPIPDCVPQPCPPPPPPPECKGLDRSACDATEGCYSVVCTDCQGVTSFAGCDGPGGSRILCPRDLCPGECRTAADCVDSGGSCLPPGAFPGCGACFNPEVPCTADADCGQSGIICTEVACSCNGGTYCQPGCMSDDACAEGEICDRDFHCRPQGCVKPDQCPTNFDCDQGICVRLSCSEIDDSPCNPNYCVAGRCHAQPGQCVGAPPP